MRSPFISKVMSSPEPGTEVLAAALERDSAWLHALARALTRDPEAASDAAQDTLLRAWTRAPGGAPPARSWLVRVLTNTLRETGRRAGMRMGKEAGAARPERIDPGPDGLERLELQRGVIDAVEALDEPYRTTLVLRFFDGLSARSIASRTGVPRKTVYTRIERGLARLREQLDRRFDGGRRSWLGAFLALPPPRPDWVPLVEGAGVMGAGIKLVGGTAMVALGVMLFIRSQETAATAKAVVPLERSAPGVVSAGAVEAAEPEAIEPMAARTRAEGARPAEPVPDAAEADPEPAAPAPTLLLDGRVLGLAGQALAGVTVRARRFGVDGPTTRTDGSGDFRLSVSEDELPWTLILEDPGYASVREAFVTQATARRRHVLVGAPAADLRGVVVDDQGSAVPEALVVAVHDEALLVDFPHELDTTLRVNPSQLTDEDGRFELGGVPLPVGTSLRVTKWGFGAVSREVTPADGLLDLRIELRPLVGDEAVSAATGFVLLPDGRPAEGATVRYGLEDTRTGHDGSFDLPLVASPRPEHRLAAGLEGYGTAIVERYGELQAQAHPYSPVPVTLILGEAPKTLAGTVIDSRGAPLAGWRVELADGTELTLRQTPPVLAESLTGYRVAATDEAGHFALESLLDRDYALAVWNPTTMVFFETGPLAAGDTEVVIEVPDGLSRAHLSGRVVSRTGVPVPKARVSVSRVMHRMKNGMSYQSGDEAETDDQGRFELFDVPVEGAVLSVAGEQVVPFMFDYEQQADLDDLRIEVALRCHFRVEATGSDLAELEIEVHDAPGEKLGITTYTATGSMSHVNRNLIEGRMEVAATTDEAATVVLFRGSGESRIELARREVSFGPEDVNEVLFQLP